MNRSLAEIEFANQLKMCEIGGWQEEYRFHEVRQWKFDFAFPAKKVAVEIEGGVHRIKGRFQRDIEKYNTATLMGWKVLRYTPAMIKTGKPLAAIEDLIFRKN